jgi:hypothetical protein
MAYLKRNTKVQSFGLEPRVEPNSAYEGQIYYNASDALFYIYADGAWKSLSGAMQPIGGIITPYTDSGTDYIVHTFLTSSIFTTEIARDVDYLIIAGGGGGGGDSLNHGSGGGGGAGGLKYFSQKSLSVGNFSVTVGSGGAGSLSIDARGVSGTASSFGTDSATGGGGGGSRNTAVQSGLDGGSGGGGGQRDNSTANNGDGVANEGNNGGSGFEGTEFSGGGGGGAGAAGTSSTVTGVGGAGGAGAVEGTTTLYDWTQADGSTATFNINGTDNSYAGGGGGGGTSTPANGQHGGGNGATNNGEGTDATVGTGGGGGGQGGAGGSGIVIVRYTA